jgi:hypothetical protein
MTASGQDLFDTAMLALAHASLHSDMRDDGDVVQVVLSLHFAAEMLLKAELVSKGESIMQSDGVKSIKFHEALSRTGTYRNKTAIEELGKHRNELQHIGKRVAEQTVRGYYQDTLLFAEEAARRLGRKLPPTIDMVPFRVPIIAAAERVFDTDALQRDLDADGETVVWAQGAEQGTLAVHVQRPSGEIQRLTPEGEFEYLPRTDGQSVVAFRQSGGVVLYDLVTCDRKLISETGAPTDINKDWIAAQGRAVPDGLGGGIWLYARRPGEWFEVDPCLSASGAQLGSDSVVWTDLDASQHVVRRASLADLAGPVAVVARNATHPSISGRRLAYDTRGQHPGVSVAVAETGQELYQVVNGLFPDVHGGMIAYLSRDHEGYWLGLDDVVRKRSIVKRTKIGFPLGRGPVLTGHAVYFEASTAEGQHSVYRMRFTYTA